MVGSGFVSPIDDFYFRLAFANPLAPSPLANLIRVFLPEYALSMKDLAIIDPASNLKNFPVKTGLASVLVTTHNDQVHNVEIAVTSNPLERVETILYLKDRQFQRMFKYLPESRFGNRVATILISSYTMMLDSQNYLNRVDFEVGHRVNKGLALSRGSLWVYELPNLPLFLENQELWAWLNYFKAQNSSELLEAASSNPEIAEAHAIYRSYLADRRSSECYEIWRAERDEAMNKAYQRKTPAELWPEAIKKMETFGLGDKWSTIQH
ncbi:MAG: hypothetical protein LBT38_09480 [Deltaproteobacteria bacterium]|jgi:hypothetical protein|nr:hypothetical protein [Deltaproteobacteria bacterium]